MRAIIFPLESRMQGTGVGDLQDALKLLLGREVILADDDDARGELSEELSRERGEQTYGGATKKLVRTFQEARSLETSGAVDEPTANALNAQLDEWGLLDVEDGAVWQVSGRVFARASVAVGGLDVQIVDRSIGEAVEIARTPTDEDGGYETTFLATSFQGRGKSLPDLQARVFTHGVLVGASRVQYNASPREVLHVEISDQDATSLRSEHDTLTGALGRHFTGSMADLQETGERPDITYLANKTGWDARAVAMAALAAQFSKNSAGPNDPGLEAPLFYAMFRAGLPADDAAIYRASPATVRRVWVDAIEKGVIASPSSQDLNAAVARFENLAAQRSLAAPATIGPSSLHELLAMSLTTSEDQTRFAEIYARHRDDTSTLWEKVNGALGEAATQRLKLDGKLAYLTLNNAPLIRAIHATAHEGTVTDVSELVDLGYHKAVTWQSAVATVDVPAEIPGASEEQRRERYAEMLAAQIRLSLPTRVIAQMVKDGDTPVGQGAAQSVHQFLLAHDGDFEIALQPVQQYVSRNGLPVEQAVVQEITRVQRVYQLTPGDAPMNALLEAGVDSAYAVTRYDREEFVHAFEDRVGGESAARLIHARAQQVHNTILNITMSYLTAANAPAVGRHSDPRIINPAPGPNPNPTDVIAYPTLEALLGSQDYCECQHCRSVLSPAAYLVDLLLYCDREDNELENPLTVLLERRPDLQHLPLTCENTNLALPYIDVVNETLEYYIANGLSLASYEGHSTDGSAEPDSLLASPQFVTEAAYTTLAGRPLSPTDPPPTLPPVPPLPFHQPLEQLRRYFGSFDAPLATVMEALRATDAIERPAPADPARPVEYGWRDILMEELALSRPEYDLLTDRSRPLQSLYGYPATMTEPQMVGELSEAKAFAKRMAISYTELAAVLRTRFVNPSAALLPKLERLGLSFGTIKRVKEGDLSSAELDALLAPHIDPQAYGGDIHAWLTHQANYDAIMGLITLTPDATGGVWTFDDLRFRYSDPETMSDPVRSFEFVRLYRFIRLWRKLGWSIEQTDLAIAALYPQEQAPNHPNDAVNLERLDAGFLILLPRLGGVRRMADALGLSVSRDLSALLSCFAPIDRSLYRQMFLGPERIAEDPAFADDGYGNVLAGSELLRDHIPALRAAFGLTVEEVALISGALGFDADRPLTLTTISAVFRRGWLARELSIGVRQLLLLTDHLRLDPFAPLDPANPPMQRLIDLHCRLRRLSFPVEDLLSLVWNDDVGGVPGARQTSVTTLARALRGELGVISREFAVIDDPSDEIAVAKMALVYGSDATDRFFGLLEQTVVTDVAYVHSTGTLEQATIDAAGGHLTHDHLRHRLAYTAGVMPDAIRDDVLAEGSIDSAAINELAAKTSAFFLRYPELKALHDAYVAPTVPPASPVEKRRALLDALLPQLEFKRQTQHALQAVSADLDIDLELATLVADDPAVLHAVGDAARPAIDDAQAVVAGGLSVEWFFADTTTGAVADSSDATGALVYGPEGQELPAAPTPAVSAVFRGYLGAPENGPYELRIDTDAATVVLDADGVTIPLTQSDTDWSTGPLQLRAGSMMAIALTVQGVATGLTVSWETHGRGWEPIPAAFLYSETLVDRLSTTYTRLQKAAGLAGALNLSAREIAYLAAHPDYRIDSAGWLNALPVDGGPASAVAVALADATSSLFEYARLKETLHATENRLLAVLKNPVEAARTPEGTLFTLTGWDTDSLDALLIHFGHTDGTGADHSALADLLTFARVHDASVFVDRLRIPATALIAAVTNEPTADVARDLLRALRARNAGRDWFDVIKPINDELRALQRDALVGYILHQMSADTDSAHIDTPEKLFEYFLMDVQMQPCTQTSRVRHALSTVQLFIERCLMSLEARVAPSSFNTGEQWEWMRRYRLWEANRKVFLFPENWLEPELRDDKSVFFTETMSELLQSDITDDAASSALLKYLVKLEEVAKLEPCGIHYVEGDESDGDNDVSHVVARTSGAGHKYFYRRYDQASWSPWEPINLDIEDRPVIPVVWKSRLFLFWVKLIKQGSTRARPTVTALPGKTLDELTVGETTNTDTKITVTAILCYSEYLDGRWQTMKTLDPQNPADLGSHDPAAFDRSKVNLEVASTGDTLRIRIRYASRREWRQFTLYNTHSRPLWTETTNEPPPPEREIVGFAGRLEYGRSVQGRYRPPPPSGPVWRVILNPDITMGDVVEPRHPLEEPWFAPFLCDDSRHAFYVTTRRHYAPVQAWDRVDAGAGVDVGGSISPFVSDQLRPSMVTEDVFLDRTLPGSQPIGFGDRIIGPGGAIEDPPFGRDLP